MEIMLRLIHVFCWWIKRQDGFSEEKRESAKKAENRRGGSERKGGREREEDRGKGDALEAPSHEILIIYLHGYQEPSHCLYILYTLYHYSSIFTFWPPQSDSKTFLCIFTSFCLFSFPFSVFPLSLSVLPA